MRVYIRVFDPPKIEWHFSGRLTFSNTRGRIYRLALPLRTPEKVSSLNKY